MQFWAAPPPLTVVLVSPKAEGMTDAFYVEEDGRFAAQPQRYGPWGRIGYWLLLMTSAAWPVLVIVKIIFRSKDCKW